MSFLAPWLLAGLLAIAIPVIVHLVQRDRRRVVEFPSLMFLRKIPNQSVKRRAVRHWPLLALRILALALLALAFARPFLQGSANLAASGGGREVIILLDRSLSMGYGDHWDRARGEARRVVGELGPDDRATVMFFDTDVEIGPRSASDRASLVSAIDRVPLSARATRIGPALRAAAGQLESSRLARREVVVVSDFQRSSWDRSSDARLPAGVTLKAVFVGEAATTNASVVGLTFDRTPLPGGERVTATARIVNRSASALKDRLAVLEVDGHRIDEARISAGPGAVTRQAFAPFTVAGTASRVTVRLEADALPADDSFHAVVTAGGRVPVLIVESSNPSPEASLYLTRALGVGADPGFTTVVERADRVTPAQINAATVIVINDTHPPTGAAARALDARVRAGTGLFVALGERSTWTAGDPDLLPGTLGAVTDRSGTRGGTLGFVDYSHAVFEIFSTPRSGDLTAARVFRYRTLASPPTVLARFDDGAAALAERRAGAGTVLAWASSLDSYWNDLALKPVFVPFVLQAMKHLARYEAPRSWYTVGEALESRRPNAAGVFLLNAPGFLDVPAGVAGADGPSVVAANVAPGESDLSAFEPAELVAAVTVPGAAGGQGETRDLTAEEIERRQSTWWYFLVLGLLLLLVEGIVASRLPRIA